jgi:hypothetical protein
MKKSAKKIYDLLKPKPGYFEFCESVSKRMKRYYGITWEDACGDDKPLLSAYNADETPEEFVSWWAEKNDMQMVGEIDPDELIDFMGKEFGVKPPKGRGSHDQVHRRRRHRLD